jgi:hypothetical protein
LSELEILLGSVSFLFRRSPLESFGLSSLIGILSGNFLGNETFLGQQLCCGRSNRLPRRADDSQNQGDDHQSGGRHRGLVPPSEFPKPIT